MKREIPEAAQQAEKYLGKIENIWFRKSDGNTTIQYEKGNPESFTALWDPYREEYRLTISHLSQQRFLNLIKKIQEEKTNA